MATNQVQLPSLALSASGGPWLPYQAAAVEETMDLLLASNECTPVGASPRMGADAIARYPSAVSLERAIAGRLGVDAAQVVVTAGADDALLRAALAFLGPGRTLTLASPTFEMIPRYARLARAEVREVPWGDGGFPTREVIAQAAGTLGVVAVVSPNNPTGAVATAEDLVELSRSLPGAVVLFDGAYSEFADEDLTPVALKLPNVVVIRTFSKAYGGAGMRVGWAAGPPELVLALRAAGNPYPVSSTALAWALCSLREPAQSRLKRSVERVRTGRSVVAQKLRAHGIRADPGQGNFVFFRSPRAALVVQLLAGLGILVRGFGDRPHLGDAVRITVPPVTKGLRRLTDALDAVLSPQALLFDMDGVLADVSSSYRAAIVETARSFGAFIDAEMVRAEKEAGDANDDWSLTHRLMARVGVHRTFVEVRERFERIYQGADGVVGLREQESLLVPAEILRALADRMPLAIVTGRPRDDAERFLARFGLGHLFTVMVAREDAPLKPHPEPVNLALRRLGVRAAWMLGDTVDDVRAARRAGVVPIGVRAPLESSDGALRRAGATVVLGNAAEILGLFSSEKGRLS
jgi:histidinol-phosphate aminotransferase